MSGETVERRVKCRCGKASIVVPWNIHILGMECTQCDNQSASGMQDMSDPYRGDPLPASLPPWGLGCILCEPDACQIDCIRNRAKTDPDVQRGMDAAGEAIRAMLERKQ